MKRKPEKKRLALVKERIRVLADRQLVLAGGGRGIDADVTSMDPVCSETRAD